MKTESKSPGQLLWESCKGPLLKDWTWDMLNEKGHALWEKKAARAAKKQEEAVKQ